MDPATLSVSGLSSAFLYLLSTAAIFRRMKAVAQGEPSTKTSPLALWGAALALHALSLYPHLVTASGIDLGFFNALSMIAWLVSFLVFASSLRNATENLGLMLLPISAICLALEQIDMGPRLLSSDADPGVKIHVVVSLLAYSLLTVATLQAIAVALQDYRLRHQHPGGLIRSLPPLQQMESLLFRFIAAGLALLSLALITGAVYLDDILAQHLVHKAVLSVIAWVLFATLLFGHWRFGWRGKTAIRWTISGFVFLMLAYFGSKFVLELVLAPGA